MLQIKILFLASCVIEYLLKGSPVFRMRLLNYSREVRWMREIQFKDPKGLSRPVDLSSCGIPAKAARVAQGLRFSQVGLASPQGIFGSPSIAVLLLQVRIEVSVLQRYRGLGGDQLQHCASGRREHPRGQVILEGEHADQRGVPDQRQAENGADAIAADVCIGGKRALRRGIVQNHALLCPYDVVEDGVRKICRCDTRLAG